MASSTRMIAFIGSVLPEDLCSEYPACSVAGNKFQLGLIRGLEQASGVPLQVISLAPVAMFPKGKPIVANQESMTLSEKNKVKFVPFVNLPILKQLSVALVIFTRLCRWLWKTRSQSRIVLVYNAFAPFSLSVLAATRLLGGLPVAIVADLGLSVTGGYSFRGLWGLLERLDSFVQIHSLSRFTAIIPLTKQIAMDFAPRLPVLIVEGGVDPVEFHQELGSETDLIQPTERICFFSGTLYEINGIELLLKAFEHLPDPHYRLWIFGKGPLEYEVKRATEQDARIVYWGFLPNYEVQKLQRVATVLLNARPSTQLITRYTFPSKLHEYMLSGRPIITSPLPGIPNEYYEYMYSLHDETPKGLADLIQRVCTQSPSELDEMGQRAREFVLTRKSWNLQGQRIYDFICGL